MGELLVQRLQLRVKGSTRVVPHSTDRNYRSGICLCCPDTII